VYPINPRYDKILSEGINAMFVRDFYLQIGDSLVFTVYACRKLNCLQAGGEWGCIVEVVPEITPGPPMSPRQIQTSLSLLRVLSQAHKRRLQQ